MRFCLAAMLVLGPLVVSCTGQGVPAPTPSSVRPVPSVVVRISKPQNVTVRQTGPFGLVVKPDSERLWAHGVVQAGGSVCATLNPPGFHYKFSDVSDAALSMAITCIADGSMYQVRVIFVPESR
jgi:hypothetical protein